MENVGVGEHAPGERSDRAEADRQAETAADPAKLLALLPDRASEAQDEGRKRRDDCRGDERIPERRRNVPDRRVERQGVFDRLGLSRDRRLGSRRARGMPGPNRQPGQPRPVSSVARAAARPARRARGDPSEARGPAANTSCRPTPPRALPATTADWQPAQRSRRRTRRRPRPTEIPSRRIPTRSGARACASSGARRGRSLPARRRYREAVGTSLCRCRVREPPGAAEGSGRPGTSLL